MKVKVTGDLDKRSFHGELGCKSLTGGGLRVNRKIKIRESKDSHSFEEFCCFEEQENGVVTDGVKIY